MSFTVSNGMRQGGMLSPILFTVYLDDLLNELKRLNVGCHWRHHFVGALYYADDIALLAPSADALRQMLKVCENFASLHGLSFNPAKTQLIRFARSPLPFNICILFYDKPLSLVNSATHLGHTLTSDLSDDLDIQEKTKNMIKKANYMLHTFSCCDKSTRTQLLQSYCLSLSECALWALSCKIKLKSLDAAFNNVLPKIWSLPQRCYTSLVQLTASMESLVNVVAHQSSGLVRKACSSASTLLQEVFIEASRLVYTSFGYNLRYGHRHIKAYTEADCLFANFLRDVVLFPMTNWEVLSDVIEASCS